MSTDATYPVGAETRTDRLALPSWVFVPGWWVCASVAEWFRLPPGARGHLFAEDGRIFIGGWINGGSIATFFEPYGGYQQLVPRLVSGAVAWLAPISRWPACIVLAACILVGGVSALTFVLTKGVVRTPFVRCTLAAIPIVVPLGRLEAVGNLADFHVYCLFLIPWLILALPAARVRTAAYAVLGVLVSMTEPQTALFLPLGVWSAVQDRRRLWWLGPWAAGLVIQLISDISTGGGGRKGGVKDVFSAWDGYLVNAVASNVTSSSRDLATLFNNVGWLPYLLFALMCAACALAIVLGQRSLRWLAPSLLGASLASWTAAYFLNDHTGAVYQIILASDPQAIVLSRWGIGPAMTAAALIPVAADVCIVRWPRRGWIAALPVIVMIALMLPWFAHGNSTLGPAPSWSVGITAGAADCRTGPHRSVVVIPTAPRGWYVAVPCSRLIG